MKMPFLVAFALSTALSTSAALAQLPESEKLNVDDQPLFRAELERVERQLAVASDKATLTYEMARTFAFAKQWPQALHWLRLTAELRLGLDPSRETTFAALRGTSEFEGILALVRAATPPVSNSRIAFKLGEGDLIPESLAFSSKDKSFYFGSLAKGKVVRCSKSGKCAQFLGGLGTVVGLKARSDGLWLLENNGATSALVHYDIASARLVRKYPAPGDGHSFNDLTFAPSGDVYLTDSRAGIVWQLAPGAAGLTKVADHFQFANGITVSPDGKLLYVSTFPDGITVLDLETHAAFSISRPDDLCLATIDGLYFHHNTLIAIQNAFMTPRVVRMPLTYDLRAIQSHEVLERRNPLFDGITTGVLVGESLYYMANIQDEKKTGFRPIDILKLSLSFPR